MDEFKGPFFDLVTLYLLRYVYIHDQVKTYETIKEKYGIRYAENCKFFKTYILFCEEYTKVSDFNLI